MPIFKSLIWLHPQISSWRKQESKPRTFRSQADALTTRQDRLVGLVVEASASRVEDLEFDSRLHPGDLSESSPTNDLKIRTPVSILPHAWCYRSSAGTGWPGVSILWLGEKKIPGLNPACAGIFSRSNHTNDLKIGTPVAILPGAWRYRVSAGSGRPDVSILWLGEVES